jgi:Sap, sulfolipid-1-addressing protein
LPPADAISAAVISVDIELALVGLVAMLEPATLVSSALAVVIGERPLRTGFWFYIGGLAVTLTVGVAAAFVLGNVAASRTSTPKTWVSVFNLVAGLLLVAYVARSLRRPPDPQKMRANIDRMNAVADAPTVKIVAAGALLANAGPFMLIALKDVSQLNPSPGQYIVDWVIFALASLLPLSLALVFLLLAPARTRPLLRAARGWIELHARAVVLVILVALAASLLRDGIAGLTG